MLTLPLVLLLKARGVRAFGEATSSGEWGVAGVATTTGE